MKPFLKNLILFGLLGVFVEGCCDKCQAQLLGGRRWQQAPYSEAQYTHSQQPNSQQPILDRKVDGSVFYNSGKVADMPVGSSKMYTTIILGSDYLSDSASGERQRAILSWFTLDQRLVKVRTESNFNVYDSTNPHFTERLREYVGDAVPIVMIQDANGSVKFCVNGSPSGHLPNTSGELADMIYESIEPLNRAPTFQGQTSSAVIQDCPPDGCPPVKPQPNLPIFPKIPEVIRPAGDSVLPVAGLIGLVVCVVGGLFFVKHRSGAADVGPNSKLF